MSPIEKPKHLFDVIFYVTSDRRHANYTVLGLLELEKQGVINLKFKQADYQTMNRIILNAQGEFDRNYRPYPWAPELKVKERSSGKEIRIAIDLQDWDTMFSYHSLKNCNVIFKRAFTSAAEKVSEQFNVPILPAGINHSASIESKSYRKLLRAHLWKHNLFYAIKNPKEIFRYLRENTILQSINPKYNLSPLNTVTVDYLKEPPSTPFVFFQVEYYDWNNKISNKINESRAKLIRSLRNSLGERFIGGMYFKKAVITPYDDCITNVPSEREIYLKFVKQASVVICTNGFGDSIPWKLPEYLQMGKCIVAEPLLHKMPVPFKADEVLFFENLKQCHDLCEKLLQSNILRITMEKNTKQYYANHILPEVSVLKMIEQSFKLSKV